MATLRSGDDIKTVQGNLGHATATFTQDVTAMVTMQMKEVSAAHIEKQFPWVKRRYKAGPEVPVLQKPQDLVRLKIRSNLLSMTEKNP